MSGSPVLSLYLPQKKHQDAQTSPLLWLRRVRMTSSSSLDTSSSNSSDDNQSMSMDNEVFENSVEDLSEGAQVERPVQLRTTAGGLQQPDFRNRRHRVKLTSLGNEIVPGFEDSEDVYVDGGRTTSSGDHDPMSGLGPRKSDSCDLSAIMEALKQLRFENNHLSKENLKLQGQLDSLEDAAREQMNTLTQLERKNRSLQSCYEENISLAQEVEDLKLSLSAVDTAKADLLQEKVHLEMEVAQLTGVVEETNKKLAAVHSLLSQNDDDVKQLQRKVDEQEALCSSLQEMSCLQASTIEEKNVNIVEMISLINCLKEKCENLNKTKEALEEKARHYESQLLRQRLAEGGDRSITGSLNASEMDLVDRLLPGDTSMTCGVDTRTSSLSHTELHEQPSLLRELTLASQLGSTPFFCERSAFSSTVSEVASESMEESGDLETSVSREAVRWEAGTKDLVTLRKDFSKQLSTLTQCANSEEASVLAHTAEMLLAQIDSVVRTKCWTLSRIKKLTQKNKELMVERDHLRIRVNDVVSQLRDSSSLLMGDITEKMACLEQQLKEERENYSRMEQQSEGMKEKLDCAVQTELEHEKIFTNPNRNFSVKICAQCQEETVHKRECYAKINSKFCDIIEALDLSSPQKRYREGAVFRPGTMSTPMTRIDQGNIHAFGKRRSVCQSLEDATEASLQDIYSTLPRKQLLPNFDVEYTHSCDAQSKCEQVTPSSTPLSVRNRRPLPSYKMGPSLEKRLPHLEGNVDDLSPVTACAARLARLTLGSTGRSLEEVHVLESEKNAKSKDLTEQTLPSLMQSPSGDGPPKSSSTVELANRRREQRNLRRKLGYNTLLPDVSENQREVMSNLSGGDRPCPSTNQNASFDTPNQTQTSLEPTNESAPRDPVVSRCVSEPVCSLKGQDDQPMVDAQSGRRERISLCETGRPTKLAPQLESVHSQSAFPSLTNEELKKMDLLPERIHSSPCVTEEMASEKFTQLSLHLRTDQETVWDRLKLHSMARSSAESNVDRELLGLRQIIVSLRSCPDYPLELATNLSSSIDILEKCILNLGHKSELLGAVEQEGRLSHAVDVMLRHVQDLRHVHHRERKELDSARKILREHSDSSGHMRNASLTGGSLLSGKSLPGTSKRCRVTTLSLPDHTSAYVTPENSKHYQLRSRSESSDSVLLPQSSMVLGWRKSSMDLGDSRGRFKSAVHTTISQANQLNLRGKCLSDMEVTGKDVETATSSTIDKEKELIFQKGFEQGVRVSVEERLLGLNCEQGRISESLDQLMDCHELTEQDSLQEDQISGHLETLITWLRDCSFQWVRVRRGMGIFTLVLALIILIVSIPLPWSLFVSDEEDLLGNFFIARTNQRRPPI